MTFKKIFIGLIVLLSSIAACSQVAQSPSDEEAQSLETIPTNPVEVIPAAEPLNPTENPLEPRDKGTCEQQGGKWGQAGFSPARCNLPTADGGTSCQSSSSCESYCMQEEASADASEEEIGVCYEWTLLEGCNTLIEDGSPVLICID